jgi:hypothetical protein
MAIFLLVAALFNLWFITTSYRRAFVRQHDASLLHSESTRSTPRVKLLEYSVLAMSLFDILWVWCCMVQCWYNTFHDASTSPFNQAAGPDSVGCKFMGWYSTFSLVSMMGSHCLVVYYLKNLLMKSDVSPSSNTATQHFSVIVVVILIGACMFASMPLMLLGGPNGGYLLTNGGFCYADFTDTVQSSIMLTVVTSFLLLATTLWCRILTWQYATFYVVFFVTWSLWIPSTAYGIATGNEIPPPYMIIGAIVGHGNALVNPILYGVSLFKILEKHPSYHGAQNENSALIMTKQGGVAGMNNTDDDADSPQITISHVA